MVSELIKENRKLRRQVERLSAKGKTTSTGTIERGLRGIQRRVQRAMQGTVWTAGGCASWYIDKHGRNTTLWPGFTFKFRELTRSFDREHYELRPAPVREEVYA